MESMESAARDLDAGAFKLYMYFVKNADYWKFALSSRDAKETFGINKKQYDNAIAELIEKNYLIYRNGNYYDFYDKAQNRTINDEEK